MSDVLRVAGAVWTWPVTDVRDAGLPAGWGVAGMICDDLTLVERLAAGRPVPGV